MTHVLTSYLNLAFIFFWFNIVLCY
uniref:Uncharacterized protein n=1 Tax=Anguilla anguilla TaxID=7936 RepID=A0A0E9U003_ANGAN